MRKMFVFVLSLCFFFTVFNISANAEEAAILQEVTTPYDVRSTVSNQGVSIPDFIDECKQNTNEPHNLNMELWELTDSADTCRWDESLFIIRYPITLDRLNAIADGSSIETVLGDSVPAVLIPLFATNDGVERMGGCICMFSGQVTGSYHTYATLVSQWAWGEAQSIFEKIDAFNNYESVKEHFPNATIHSMILLQFNLSYDLVGNMILLVQTDTGMKILDITNAAHNSEAEEVYGFPETRVYTLEEFITYRTAYEEEAYQPNPSGFAGGDVQLPQETWNPTLIVIPILIIVAGIGAFIIIKRLKRNN